MKERRRFFFFVFDVYGGKQKEEEKAWKWICMVLGSGGEGKN